MLRPSGPTARELTLFLIACETIPGERQDTELTSGHSLSSFRLAIQADGRWNGVNCLAKAVVISSLRVRNLEGKVMG